MRNIKNKHSLLLLLVLASPLVAILATLLSSTIALAQSTSISAPFDQGTNWFICQGYNNSRITHQGADALALDLSGPNCDNTAKGRNVRAPLDGKVRYYGAAYGSACIDTSDGRSIALIHIDSNLRPGDIVNEGQSIGTIAPENTRGSGPVAHLHLQMWAKPGCYNDAPIPFSLSHNSRICGAPDMPINGPDAYKNGTWSGVSFTAASCTTILQSTPGSIYRFWSNPYGRHFYTASHIEAQQVVDKWPDKWQYEGVAFTSDTTCSGSSVYRFWSSTLNGHFYTASAEERDEIIRKWPNVWTYEGVAYCSANSLAANTKPVYRFWSAAKQAHFYTSNLEEKDAITLKWPETWSYEGIAYYVY